MISKKMAKALSDQMGREFASAYIYLAMGGKAAEMDFKGTNAWMKAQAAEEMSHGMKMYEYLLGQGAETAFPAVEAPPVKYGSLVEIFSKALAHEKKVTRWLNDLMDIAMAEKDYATQGFLQWFINEQVEEEATAMDIVAQLKMAGEKSGTLLMLDRQLGKRGEK